MKVKTLSLLAGAGAMMIAGVASADFAGISVEHHTTWNNEGTEYDVYRLYANFDADGGTLTAWGTDQAQNGYVINSLASDGNSPGSGFFQTGFAGSALVQANSALYGAFADEFDHSTYITIGNAAGYEPVVDPNTNDDYIFSLVPGHNPDVTQQTWGGVGGVFTIPDAPYGQAGPGGSVLMAQFTVLAGEHVEGELYVTIAGEGESDRLSFSTVVPAPGAVALLGLAGLVGTRRRRA